jgi:histidine triad (HIT) family protein
LKVPYDRNNVFARILRGEIPCKKVYESAHALAFYDIAPQMPVHVLVIPKGAYVNMDDFTAKASTEELADFARAIGEDAHQEVQHLHVHVFGGKRIGGRMIKPD